MADDKSIPFAVRKNYRDSEAQMKQHLETIKNHLKGRQVDFVIDHELGAIHALAQSLGLGNGWPEILLDYTVSEIAKAIGLAANHENPRLKSSFFDSFTGNKIIYRVPSINNPDGNPSVKYSFENGNLICIRGSDIHANIDNCGRFYNLELALKPNFNVSSATSAADIEKMWVEAINDVVRREDFDTSMQGSLDQLLKKGAKIDLAVFGERNNLTAGSFIMGKWTGESNFQCIEFLVSNGADIYRLIDTAIWRSRKHLFKLLTRAGTDVNHRDENGRTFLHHLAMQYENPKLTTKVRTTSRRVHTSEVWVNPANEIIAYKDDQMHQHYDSLWEGLKSVQDIDVAIKDVNGRTALDLARHLNNIWILPGLETFHNSRLGKVSSSPQPAQAPVPGAPKKFPLPGKPQTPTSVGPKFNAQTMPAKLPKELLSLLNVMYHAIRKSTTDTRQLEQEYEKFVAIFGADQ